MSDNCPDDIELHRPYIDAVTITCPKCGKQMHRVPEVIDCWFDSGSMPFAQHHYPFENKELFEKQFPADFISEAVDQTRGWFYSLLAISTLIFNKAPFKNVHRPGPCAGRERPEDEQVQGQRGGSLRGPGQVRRGRHPLVFLHQLRPLAAQPLPRQGGAARGSASSWAPCGTPTPSLCCTPTSTNFDPTQYTLEY